MTKISSFVQVREDGRIIQSTITVKDMLALGWGPSKVTALRWRCDDKEKEVRYLHGVHGIVVPGLNFVAAIYRENEGSVSEKLIILSSDGFVRGEIENRVALLGQELSGTYRWFEPAMSPRADAFGTIFQTEEGESLRCDVDASTLSIVSAIRVR